MTTMEATTTLTLFGDTETATPALPAAEAASLFDADAYTGRRTVEIPADHTFRLWERRLTGADS